MISLGAQTNKQARLKCCSFASVRIRRQLALELSGSTSLHVAASIGPPPAAAVPTASGNSPIVSMKTAAAHRLVLVTKAGWSCQSSASLVSLVMPNHFAIALALVSIVPGHTSPVMAPRGGLYLMIALISPETIGTWFCFARPCWPWLFNGCFY